MSKVFQISRMTLNKSIVMGLLILNGVLANDWISFKTTWGKEYSSPMEESFRRSIFEKNMALINEHNEKYEKGLVSYQMGMNYFGDLTDNEFREKMLILNMSAISDVPKSIFRAPNDSIDYPSEVDWRKEGAVSPVKNNGLCGSSYAFSAIGSLEGQYFRKNGRLLSFSVQQLVDCSSHFSNYGCRGGMPHRAFWYIIYNKGISLEAKYPYTGQAGPCRFDLCQPAAKIVGIKELPKSEETLKAAVATVGPISVCIDATAQFKFYKKGVFVDNTCSSSSVNLAVLAVGYGIEGGHEYWLIKNAWGEEWGDRGYIKMSRNNGNQCAISSVAVFPIL